MRGVCQEINNATEVWNIKSGLGYLTFSTFGAELFHVFTSVVNKLIKETRGDGNQWGIKQWANEPQEHKGAFR